MNNLKLLNILLDLGEAMLLCGAEVSRVEDTLIRLGNAYGAEKTDAFVITSNMVVTTTFSETEQYTSSRRIVSAYDNDFLKLEKLNALSRKCCKEKLSEEDFRKELENICNSKVSFFKIMLGSFFAAGSFAVFFGGHIIDGIVAAFMGLFTSLLNLIISKSISNRVAYYLLSSFTVGILISCLGIVFPVLCTDKIMIGVIMLLIPGIALTNAFRDILTGDTISGLLKFVQCFLWAFTIAGGFILALKLLGRFI